MVRYAVDERCEVASDLYLVWLGLEDIAGK